MFQSQIILRWCNYKTVHINGLTSFLSNEVICDIYFAFSNLSLNCLALLDCVKTSWKYLVLSFRSLDHIVKAFLQSFLSLGQLSWSSNLNFSSSKDAESSRNPCWQKLTFGWTFWSFVSLWKNRFSAWRERSSSVHWLLFMLLLTPDQLVLFGWGPSGTLGPLRCFGWTSFKISYFPGLTVVYSVKKP